MSALCRNPVAAVLFAQTDRHQRFRQSVRTLAHFARRVDSMLTKC